MAILFSFIATLTIIFIVPIFVYGLFVAFLGLNEPQKKRRFFVGVLLQKIGTAIGFVALFYMGQEYFVDNWLLYGLIWFIMFSFSEIGELYTSHYSKKEATAGIISEAIYFPLSAYVISLLLG